MPLLRLKGPTTQLTFLRLVIYTSNMTAGISQEHKQDILFSLQSLIRKRNKCTKHQLLSLVRKLFFGCKVVPAGRIFLRCLMDLSSTVSCMHHHLRLCTDACLDLDWWLAFLPTWNGTSYILETNGLPQQQCLCSQMYLAPWAGGCTGQDIAFKPTLVS